MSDFPAPLTRSRTVGPDVHVDARRGRGRASAVVWIPAVAVALAMLLPVGYLLVRASQAGTGALDLVTDAQTLRLLGRTVGLAVAVTAASMLLGVPIAWLTTRSDLPARRTFAVLTAVPLVIPTYVGAYTLIAAVAPGGLVEDWLTSFGVQVDRMPSPYGFWGAFASLTLFTYPYVLLTVQAALRGIDPALEEASRGLGHSARQTFRRVTLPQLRPSIAAGGLLVTLYVLSDFGAVSLMRYSTFTRAIYVQYQSAFDRTPAAVLGLMLVALTVFVLTAEARASGGTRGFRRAHGTGARAQPTVRLGGWRWPAVALCATVVLAALVLPLTVIVWWLVRGLQAGEPIGLMFSAAGHSLQAALLGAGAAVAAALPVALWSVRHPSRTSRLAERAAFTGYALPGIVVALSLVFFGARYAGALYQTTTLLVFAYVVLFLPQAVGAIRASLLQIAPNVEEAARSLGSTPAVALWRVVVPLARRGAAAGAAIVFLTVMKELPATLLLAPTGFDTLATRIWAASSEAFFTRAAAPALLLIVFGSIPLAFLVVKRRDLAA